MDSDILQKVITCGFSFDCWATSVNLQRGKAWLPACPLPGRAMMLTFRSEGQWHLSGDRLTTLSSQPKAQPEHVLLHGDEGGFHQSLDCASCGRHAAIDH